MKIACLGWGSLIWEPGNLLVQKRWFDDGPLVPVEFLRQSNNGRITLVIDKLAKPVQSLWTLTTVSDLEQAKESLRIREGSTRREYIHSHKRTDTVSDNLNESVHQWMTKKDLDAVIWTGLPCKFNGVDFVRPTIEQVLAYLSEIIDPEVKEKTEEYIRKAPKQIDTEYRRAIEKALQWYPSEY